MSLHLKVGSDFIHHLEGLIKAVFHGLAHQGAADVKSALETIKGHAEDTLAQVAEKAESAQGDMFHLQSHQAVEPEQETKNSNPGTEQPNLGTDENGATVGGPTSVPPVGGSVAAQQAVATDSSASATDSSSSSSSSASTPSAPTGTPEQEEANKPENILGVTDGEIQGTEAHSEPESEKETQSTSSSVA